MEMRRCLTGFKYIGDIIAELEEKEGNADSYLLGFEESYGYLSGGYVRDKDARGRQHAHLPDGLLLQAPGQDSGGRDQRAVREVRLLPERHPELRL